GGDSGADRYERGIACSAAGSDAVLGHTPSAHVVGQHGRAPGARLHGSTERNVVPAEVLRPDRDTVILIDDTWHGHADRDAIVDTAHPLNEVTHRVEYRVGDVITDRDRHGCGSLKPAVRGHDPRLDHRSADVNADHHAHAQ